MTFTLLGSVFLRGGDWWSYDGAVAIRLKDHAPELEKMALADNNHIRLRELYQIRDPQAGWEDCAP